MYALPERHEFCLDFITDCDSVQFFTPAFHTVTSLNFFCLTLWLLLVFSHFAVLSRSCREAVSRFTTSIAVTTRRPRGCCSSSTRSGASALVYWWGADCRIRSTCAHARAPGVITGVHASARKSRSFILPSSADLRPRLRNMKLINSTTCWCINLCVCLCDYAFTFTKSKWNNKKTLIHSVMWIMNKLLMNYLRL